MSTDHREARQASGDMLKIGSAWHIPVVAQGIVPLWSYCNLPRAGSHCRGNHPPTPLVLV